MSIIFALASLTFAPPTAPIGRASVAPRSRSPTALLDVTSLLASSLPAAAIPEGFESLMAVPEKPKLGSMLMEMAGTYIIVSGALTFLPVLKARIKEPDATTRVINYLEKDVPESKFGWHQVRFGEHPFLVAFFSLLTMRLPHSPAQVDLRTPLPSFEELTEHPIGVAAGKRAYLCHQEAAVAYYTHQVTQGELPTVEVSKEFSKHYGGERVYICYK